MVGDALGSHSVKLHVDCNNCYPGDKYDISSANARGGDVIPESSATCQDNPNANPPLVCQFPGLVVTRWKGDFTFLKDQPLNYPDEASCETQTPPGGSPGTGPACVRRFPHGPKESSPYALFWHAFVAAKTFLPFSNSTFTSISFSSPP